MNGFRRVWLAREAPQAFHGIGYQRPPLRPAEGTCVYTAMPAVDSTFCLVFLLCPSYCLLLSLCIPDEDGYEQDPASLRFRFWRQKEAYWNRKRTHKLKTEKGAQNPRPRGRRTQDVQRFVVSARVLLFALVRGCLTPTHEAATSLRKRGQY